MTIRQLPGQYGSSLERPIATTTPLQDLAGVVRYLIGKDETSERWPTIATVLTAHHTKLKAGDMTISVFTIEKESIETVAWYNHFSPLPMTGDKR
jgi:hypothetical protein